MAFMDMFRPQVPQAPQPTQLPDQTQQLREMVSSVRGMLKGDPWATINGLAASNPEVAKIVQKYKAMTPEQAYASIGLDLGQVSSLIS